MDEQNANDNKDKGSINEKLLAKIDYWRKKLLDLTLRNRLISFKDYKTSTLLLQSNNSGSYLKELLNNCEIHFYKYDYEEDKESDENEEDKDGKKEDDLLHIPKGDLDKLVETLQPSIWLPNHSDKLSEKRLYNLYLKSNESLKEQGVNTLFVAFGFLSYTDSKHSDQILRAPLVLVPIEIDKIGKPVKHQHAYTVKSLEDGYEFNPALKQKLLSEFGFELPELVVNGEDDFDEEINVWIKSLEKAIEHQPNWEITTEICLGIFTFEKLQMYLDIDKNKDDVLSNALLQALVGGSLEKMGSFEGVPEENTLDEVLSPSKMLQVLDADSSQQVAIEAAKQNVSFVIQGPPGTGKSQTIVNIIAELLAQGKKVLFVSEKMAALEVVKDRLDSVGLGDYCLELHSHKANKKNVLKQLEKQLNNRLEVATSVSPSTVYKNLASTKNRLNTYGKELLKPRGALEFTLYTAIGKYKELDKKPYMKHIVDDIQNVNAEDYNNRINSLKRLESYSYEIENYNNHPWKGLKINEYSITKVRDLTQESQKNNKLVLEFGSLLSGLRSKYNVNLEKHSDLVGYNTFISVLTNKPDYRELDKHWLVTQAKDEFEIALNLIELNENLDNLKKRLTEDYREDFLKIDYEEYLNEIESKYNTNLKIIKPSYWQMKSKLNKYALVKKSFKAITEDLEELKQIKYYSDRLDELYNEASNFQYLPTFQNAERWYEIKEVILWLKELLHFNEFVTPEYIDRIVNDYQDCKQNGINFSNNFGTYNNSINSFIDNYFDREMYILNNPFEETKVEIIEKWVAELVSENERIKDWIDFNNTFSEIENELKDFVKKYIDKNYKANELTESYIKSFLENFIEYYLKESDLANYDSKKFDQDIESFRRLDKQIADISKSILIEQLESKKPGLNSFSHTSSSELATLRKEILKERRHMPLRQLLEKVSGLITTLKPCFMMSPLSVAHYIDLEKMDLFDCVIFDEASQIMPEDAVCSLIRAKSAIIVGDTQQLPPTSFFSNIEVEFDIDEELEDLNSILGEASAVLGEKYLKWHYRSRDEDLIAFSNKYFYDSRLITFPNNEFEDKKTGVKFVHVPNGVYDRGDSRKNIIEAKKIVELIKEHIEKTPDKSLGVVAFSMQQQRAVMEQVEVFIKQNPRYTTFFENENILDEFFIKNLENVQGDERDVMIFSIGYGPDKAGKMSLNFGPINKTGGFKRLNVAITRAKEKVILVSSFNPEDIPVENLTNTGVRYLLDYMRYAKNGQKELQQDLQVKAVIDLESSFEESVYEKLVERGWELSTQVGVSGYRIDLAVKHPKHRGKFILGIECDGKAYHSSKTARDRDRLRQTVLENLGWNIHRIWSTDWLINSDKEIEKIEHILNNIIENNNENTNTESDVKKNKESENLVTIKTTNNEKKIEFPQYKRLKLNSVSGGIERFNYSYYSYLERQILNVVNVESPVHIDIVIKRIAEAWGFMKIGANIKRKVDQTIRSLTYNKKVFKRDNVLWKEEPLSLVQFRLSTEDVRPFECTPKEELSTLLLELLKQSFSIEKDDLLLEVSKYLGFARRGSHIQDHLKQTISYLIKNKLVIEEAKRIKINE